MFQDKYILPSEPERRYLGQGGASVVTERYASAHCEAPDRLRDLILRPHQV